MTSKMKFFNYCFKHIKRKLRLRKLYCKKSYSSQSTVWFPANKNYRKKMRNFAQIIFRISRTFSRNFSFFSRNDDKFFKQKNLCNLEKILVSFTKFLINQYREKMRNFCKTKKQNFPQIREKKF